LFSIVVIILFLGDSVSAVSFLLLDAQPNSSIVDGQQSLHRFADAVTYFLSDEKGEATPNNVDLALEVNLFVGTLIKTCLQDLHQLETWSEKQLNIIRKINEKQALVKSEGPTYYFVGFFGDKLGVYNGLQFVYRFADRREALSVETYLQTSFSTGGIELGEIHHSLEELSALNETVASARIVVLKLQPRIKQINSLQPTANQRHHGVNQFVYVTQKKPSGMLKRNRTNCFLISMFNI